MQNAFASTGGMLDLAGVDVQPAAAAVANARRVVDAARDAGVPVIYLVMGYPLDQSTAGGEDSPNPRKELALCLMRERPELRGKLLTIGSWDFQIVDALTPAQSDLVITKSRYSGFAGTPLDALLRGRGIRTLLMAGIASNVCVESTLRDAYFHEYWPVMIEDATMPAGSARPRRWPARFTLSETNGRKAMCETLQAVTRPAWVHRFTDAELRSNLMGAELQLL